MDDELIIKSILQKFKKVNENDHLQLMTNGHHKAAINFYVHFQEGLLKELEEDLNEIKQNLQIQLGRTVKKLQSKIKGNYMNSLAGSFHSFYIQSFISKEVKEVKSAIGRLRQKVNDYVNEFCGNILHLNLKKQQQVSLYHYSNHIKCFNSQWHSVTTRAPLSRAQVKVSGFYRPQTTWLALGVSKKLKQYGKVKKNLAKQDFMGNIYLNGSNTYDEEYRLKKDLNNNDIFVIESSNRMVWVYRKFEGKNKKQTFIMDDNIKYYFYVAMRGPIQLQFHGQ